MKQAKKRSEFSGVIQYISSSPHGDPEGIVFEDGTFVKIPPHSLINKKLFRIGNSIQGEGEMLTEVPNSVFHHAKVKMGSQFLSDDTGDHDQKETMKAAHKKDVQKRQEISSKRETIHGCIVAIGIKPKGEVDRLIFKDGTSVHIPKEIELFSGDIQIGATVEVQGQTKQFDLMRFMKAEQIRRI